ncbi:hypothetical protein Tco_0580737, partial [Tanacetum coccineum]
MTKAITDFEVGTVTIYPEIDPFLEDIKEEEKSLDDWDHMLDFNLDDVPPLGEEELPPFVCKMGKSGHKVELDGKIVKEKEETLQRIKGKALKEKNNPEAFIFPIRLEDRLTKMHWLIRGRILKSYGLSGFIELKLGREDMKNVDREITMINHTQAEAMGILTNVLCQVGVTTLIAKFLILDIPIDRDSPIVVGRGFLRTIGGIVNTPERLFSTFNGFCHQTFRAARSDVIRNTESDSDDEEECQIQRNKFGAPIYGPKPSPYLNCNDPAERSLAIQTEHTEMRPDHQDPNALDNIKPWKRMGCDGEIDDMLRIRLREAGSDEDIYTSVAWIRAFNINELIYAKLYHEFYSTYENDEVYVDDELQTKLGLYQAVELKEEGFNVYFEGGLCSDEPFNAQDYWLSISREEKLGLSRSHTSTIRNPILRVIHKMITYGLCQRTSGYDKGVDRGCGEEL